MFTEEQIERYSRQIILPEIGGTGQQKLLDGSVLLVGVGGLGSPAALYLAAAGVGRLGIIDADTVDLSNLQRQVLHGNSDVGRPKVESAADALGAINDDVTVETYQERLTADNALNIIGSYDFVIDATDNFSSKFLVADACHFAGKPYSHAGVLGFQGQTITVIPKQTTCYRCVFDRPPPSDAVPTCSQAGILGSVAGIFGTIQATEAAKYLVGAGDLLTGRLLTVDALSMLFRTIVVRRNPRCRLCGDTPTILRLEQENPEPDVCDLTDGCCPERNHD